MIHCTGVGMALKNCCRNYARSTTHLGNTSIRLYSTKPKVVAMCGPRVASEGISDITTSLARRMNGEIINLDAHSFYKGLENARIQKFLSRQRDVSVHCINVLEQSDAYNPVMHTNHCKNAIEDVLGRGKLPILVGTSGNLVRKCFPGEEDGIFENISVDFRGFGFVASKWKLELANEILCEDLVKGGFLHSTLKSFRQGNLFQGCYFLDEGLYKSTYRFFRAFFPFRGGELSEKLRRRALKDYIVAIQRDGKLELEEDLKLLQEKEGMLMFTDFSNSDKRKNFKSVVRKIESYLEQPEEIYAGMVGVFDEERSVIRRSVQDDILEELKSKDSSIASGVKYFLDRAVVDRLLDELEEIGYGTPFDKEIACYTLNSLYRRDFYLKGIDVEMHLLEDEDDKSEDDDTHKASVR
eukprot:Nk52_evm27s352 gene=Nk52_evmTU27s352